MKQIARKKANEERKRLESEVIWNKFHTYGVLRKICSLACSGLSFISCLQLQAPVCIVLNFGPTQYFILYIDKLAATFKLLCLTVL
jgi:hypothetical protein